MPIGEYFQVPMNITTKYSDVTNITCRFSEKRKHNEIYIKLDLPFELNCLILSYLWKNNFGEYQIIIPNDYPFKPPFWILFDTNDPKFKKAEIYQNVQYRNSWEPSISFEKDILYMIHSIMIS
jgi:ubiquitin-protein ligase